MTASAVKKQLTPHRRCDVVENDDYAAFATRVVRAYARRVGTGDVEALATMVGFTAEVDACIANAVAGLRAFGYSWAEIAARLGVTRQAVQQRWGKTTTQPHPPQGATP